MDTPHKLAACQCNVCRPRYGPKPYRQCDAIGCTNHAEHWRGIFRVCEAHKLKEIDQ